ncbi:MAG: tRNA uridine-5-carboxymethylaminomethyl(34) synthesis GTPase MnmE [Nitrospinae bacterium]|nr:tRNA uridine-5-carboxymethylaminomethyl(34) synthesis GTPase MnmE [Nitrospinota bacterium]
MEKLTNPKNTTSGDTIAAVATPVGEGGLGVIRISGPASLVIISKIFRLSRGEVLPEMTPRNVYFGKIFEDKEPVDEVCAVYFRAPQSYTAEDVVEISCHGSPAVMRKILKLVMANGARIAEPGEFTKRAFLNGRMDLSQAEGVVDLIKSVSEGAARSAYRLMEGGLSARIDSIRQKLVWTLSNLEASIDFPDEDFQTAPDEHIVKTLEECAALAQRLIKSYDGGRFITHGINVAIIGKANAGKSSLLNALTEEERSIVTHHPGTTRDLIRAETELSGMKVELVDTAGLNPSPDEIEAEGIRRSLIAARTADVVLGLFDGSRPWDASDDAVVEVLKKSARPIAAVNKADLPSVLTWGEPAIKPIYISVRDRGGFKELAERFFDGIHLAGEEPVVTRLRHREIFERILSDLTRAKEDLKSGRELSAAGVWDAIEEIKRFTGESYTEEVLDAVFAEFCVGK